MDDRDNTVGSSFKERTKRALSFNITAAAARWWQGQPDMAKIAFYAALLIGFFSHLFIYTSRYYGWEDAGRITYTNSMVVQGRWLNAIINRLSFGYVLPLTAGIFVSVFLAAAAFFVITILDIRKKSSAILCAALLATFPSIAATNLYLYDTPSYHFGVLLSVLAVYLAQKWRYGFLPAAVLLMCSLLIYQSKFNVAIILCLLALIKQTLDKDICRKKLSGLCLRFALMGILGGVFYALFLAGSSFDYSGYNGTGMGTRNMADQLLSVPGFLSALRQVYGDVYELFFSGKLYLTSEILLAAYICAAALIVLFLAAIIVKEQLWRQWWRLVFLAVFVLLLPFAANFALFFQEHDIQPITTGYAAVFILVWLLFLTERSNWDLDIVKSLSIVTIIVIVMNYVFINNVHYLQAYYLNQRTDSLVTRILGRVDPLITRVGESPYNYITFFGGLPNEYYPEVPRSFGIHGESSEMASPALGYHSFIAMQWDDDHKVAIFRANLERLHGVNLEMLLDGPDRDIIRQEVARRNMPAWPDEGSVDVVWGIIVVNFGIVDIAFGHEGEKLYFEALHYISEIHAGHDYEYQWRVLQDGERIENPQGNSKRFYLDTSAPGTHYQVEVTVRNDTVDFSYPTKRGDFVTASE